MTGAPDEQMPFHLAVARIDSGDLITMKEVADLTGYSYWFIRALACGAEVSRPPFPKRYTSLARRPLWLRSQIEDWHSKRRVR